MKSAQCSVEVSGLLRAFGLFIIFRALFVLHQPQLSGCMISLSDIQSGMVPKRCMMCIVRQVHYLYMYIYFYSYVLGVFAMCITYLLSKEEHPKEVGLAKQHFKPSSSSLYPPLEKNRDHVF